MKRAKIEVIDLCSSTSESETDTDHQKQKKPKVLPGDIVLSSDDDDELVCAVVQSENKVNSNVNSNANSMEKKGKDANSVATLPHMSNMLGKRLVQQEVCQQEVVDKSSKKQKSMTPLLASVQASLQMNQSIQSNNPRKRGRLAVSAMQVAEAPWTKASEERRATSSPNIIDSESSKENITELSVTHNTNQLQSAKDNETINPPICPLVPSQKRRSSNAANPSLLQSHLLPQQQQQSPSTFNPLSQPKMQKSIEPQNPNHSLRQCFSLPPEERLQLPVLDTTISRISSTNMSISPSTILQQQVFKTLSKLRKEEWQRSRRLIAENYQRALGNWQAEFCTRLEEDALKAQRVITESTQFPPSSLEGERKTQNVEENEKDTSNLSSASTITIQRVPEPARLTVVGTFQSHKSDPLYRQEIPYYRPLYNISAKVYAVHVISKPAMVSMLGRKIGTIPFLQIDSKTETLLEKGYHRSQSSSSSYSLTSTTLTSSSATSSSITPELSIKLTESPSIFNLTIPLCDTIPFAWTWIPIPSNVHKEDEVELRAMPYFGDDDTDGIDISEFKKVPGKLERELRGEAEELTVMFLLDRYQRSKVIFTALEIVLGVSIPEIINTFELITEGRWFREVIIPMLAKIDDNRKIQNMDKNLSFSMYSNDVKKDRQLLEECGNNLALWTLHGPDIPVFNVDNEINRSLGIGVGLGIQNSYGFECIISNYRTLFCRRCFTYGCQEHSTQHPKPIVRRDPLPPFPCPINHLNLPTDSVRAHLRSNNFNSAKSITATVSLEEFQYAQKTNNIPALRMQLIEKLNNFHQSSNHQLALLNPSDINNSVSATRNNSSNNLSAEGSPARSITSVRSKRPAGSMSLSSSQMPSPKRTRRGTLIDLQEEESDLNFDLLPQRAFVDSLFISSDRSIQWVHYAQNAKRENTNQYILNPSRFSSEPIPKEVSMVIEKIGDEGCKMDNVAWVKFGASLLAKEVEAYRARLEEHRQEYQSNHHLSQTVILKENIEPEPSNEASGTEIHNNATSNNHIPATITPYKASFPPAFVANNALNSFSIWKSKLGAPVLHIQDRIPELEMIPREVIMDVDDVDELEGDLRLFQESEVFSPAVTDAELSFVYKALLMFHESPPKSIAYQLNDDEQENNQTEGSDKKNKDYTLQDLIQFVSRIVGTRTVEEIQEIVLRKRIVAALRSRYEKLLNNNDLHPPIIIPTANELHEIHGISTTLSDVISLLPPIRPKNEPKTSGKPPMVKNSFESFYEPCHHEGACTIANGCSCAEKNIFCEKFCACGPSCRIKVIGCKCKSGCRFKSCPCLAASRACDPDLCSACGASIHPIFRMDVCSFIQQGLSQVTGNNILQSSTNNGTAAASSNNIILCENLPFSYRRKPLVYAGRSEIHGWGAFAGRRIEKGEYITEYTGELISQDEAERRGLIYDKHKSSYIFESNMFECIDATRKGNRARFLNHVSDAEATVGPKIMKMNGDHRIGMFAKTTIEAGQELTFNYGYSGQTAPKWSHNSRTENEGTNGSMVNMKSANQKVVNGGEPSSSQVPKLVSRKKKT